MMTARRRRKKSWISWFLILILLIVACVVVYLVWDNYFNDDKESDEPDTSEIINTGNDSTDTESEETEEPKTTEKEEIKQYEGDNPNKAEVLTGVITYAGVTSDKIMIRVNINQFLSGGTCKLRLVFEDDINVYGDEAKIIDSASTSTCEGFDVPINGFESGKYNIYITLNSGDKTGTISGEVTL